MKKGERKKKRVNEELKEIKKKAIKKMNTYDKIYGNHLTLGQKSADKLTQLAGSWTFIILFFIFLGIWMASNIFMWINRWDPYPFILLNLVLSCLAAIQAPIILMSQNRANQRDRISAEYDHSVNRKAEREIQEIKKQLDRIEKKF